MRFDDCFNVYNILMDKEMLQNFKQLKSYVMHKW